MTTATGTASKEIKLQSVNIEGETFYQITNHDQMRPFFMSIVSDSNHWMFISSNGGLSAGRKDSDNALFPYYTDDKITESAETTGSKSIFWVDSKLWEPFSIRQAGIYSLTRNLYKNTLGNKVLFEEINHDLNLTFRYQWKSTNKYGFIKESSLINNSGKQVSVKLLDGIQNIMPFGVSALVQNASSNLVDAYKRSELDTKSGLGIFALSAIIVDRAEPSEALKANIAWSLGLANPTYLLSSSQLDGFRRGNEVTTETDSKAEKGAYFVADTVQIASKESTSWMIVANVNQTASSIAEITKSIQEGNLQRELEEDVAFGSQRLINLVAASDGLQVSAHDKRNTRHYSNTLFNIMRGGIFDSNYQIEKWDFKKYLENANKALYKKHSSQIDDLPDLFTYRELIEETNKLNSKDITRLAVEYLPLKFSRRHGDPSRPWNRFSINTRSEIDGSKILDYEGNWRDIFQNWEALAHSYPEFIDGMIFKFLNTSTFDGYNPYRVTKDGFDWEAIEENDPWSYIGYWGDHQIIYLLKFLEFSENYFPGKLASYFDQDLFVYANVPYKIKEYKDICNDPKDTIEFDYELDELVRNKRDEMGSDGAVLYNADQQIVRANFIEKILTTTLAKLSNFIPEGGIWLNTQRPEWNDANNALVGNGVSMVTLYYLRRFISFINKLLQSTDLEKLSVSKEIAVLYDGIKTSLHNEKGILGGQITNEDRKKVTDALGIAGSDYRTKVYKEGFSGEKAMVEVKGLTDFCEMVLAYLDHSIKANRRDDDMYHAYNIMTQENEQEMSISYLSEMLEGQVSVLSSGFLSGKEAIKVLDAMKKSALFREDQYSFLLYPNKKLPGFLERNIIPENEFNTSTLLKKLVEDGHTLVVERDINGAYHFNGNFKNANDLQQALEALGDTQYAQLAEQEKQKVLGIFEKVFNHKAFTGRSGTFYGYEGLGSIYWHMVSKLLLAVEECCIKAVEENESPETIGKLLEHFYEINEGIGVHKSPELYGAFPTDPYSHTPLTKGAQQPGMTGQVKEDILSRIGELGVFVKDGQIQFNPCLLRKEEFLPESIAFEYVDIQSNTKSIELKSGSLAFTYCQIPIVYSISEKEKTELHLKDGTSTEIESKMLDAEISKQIFQRTSNVEFIEVGISEALLK